MKEKKVGRLIIIIAFVVILCLSKFIWFFAEKYLDTTNYEKREMAERPVLTPDTYAGFPTEYTAYANDNMAFRTYLVTLNSALDYFLFGRSSNNDVIIGNDHWLFYNSYGDGDPIGSYKGNDIYTEEELKEIADYCVQQAEVVESMGKEFVIFMAPNKERIYQEYVPKDRYGEISENYGLLQIYNYLTETTDLRVVYPYAELMEAKDKLDCNLYYKTDTHWNYIGGYVGACALLKELGIDDMPAVYSDEITIKDEGEYGGDLAGLIGLENQLKHYDREYSLSGYNRHDVENTQWEYSGMAEYHAKNADPRTLYVIRDSYSSAMAEYLGSQFNNTYLRHKDTYSYDDLVAHDPDIVVYQVVERYKVQLLSISIQ